MQSVSASGIYNVTIELVPRSQWLNLCVNTRDSRDRIALPVEPQSVSTDFCRPANRQAKTQVIPSIGLKLATNSFPPLVAAAQMILPTLHIDYNTRQTNTTICFNRELGLSSSI